MKHIHFIGIGGSGLSAIARLMIESGYAVSGSDRLLSPLVLELEALGAVVYSGHRAENIAGADVIVRSSAVPDDNPEVLAGRAAGIPVLKRSDFLGQWMANHTSIAIAGTHGKTTTTSMVAWMLTSLNLDPTYIIGGISHNLGNNAHAGKGKYFVIEADEYDRMFLGLTPQIIILTSMDYDHPDCFPTLQDYRSAFESFVKLLPAGGLLFACADDAGAASLLDKASQGITTLSYGLSEAASYFANEIKAVEGLGMQFSAWYRPSGKQPRQLANVTLQVPGEHNVRNALAALALAHQLGLPIEQAAQALASYSGSGRRFEQHPETGGVIVVDDYAHHPTEIRATLAAARSLFPSRRIWAVWQPHTYSRTQTLATDFSKAFEDADRVIVTEIYAAREKNTGYSAAQVVAHMPTQVTRFIPSLRDATTYLNENLKPGDVLLVLSAGDADQISQQVLAHLTERERYA